MGGSVKGLRARSSTRGGATWAGRDRGLGDTQSRGEGRQGRSPDAASVKVLAGTRPDGYGLVLPICPVFGWDLATDGATTPALLVAHAGLADRLCRDRLGMIYGTVADAAFTNSMEPPSRFEHLPCS